MKTAEQYTEEAAKAVQKAVETFREAISTGDEVTELSEMTEELGLTDASPGVQNLINGFWEATATVAALGEASGTPGFLAQLMGLSVFDIGESVLVASVEGAKNLEQFAELLIEVHGAVTGTDVPRFDDGNVDVERYVYARLDAGLSHEPTSVASEILEAFEALKATVS